MPTPAYRLLPAFLAIVIALGFSVGCGAKKTVVPEGSFEADKILFERGTETLNKKKWLTAREYFRQIVEGYPQSTYRGDAKLGLADSYMGDNSAESFVLAINEYREFLTFFPTHPRADYAQFKLAMAYYYQMPKAERDQTNSKEALKEFDAFFERFPNSPLAEEAKKRRRDTRDRLSESDYRVGVFYYRSRWYPGAIDRLQGVLKNDPEFTNRDGVYYYLAESLSKVGRDAEALPYLDRLLNEFEKSEFLEKARARSAELKASLPAAAPADPNATAPKPSELPAVVVTKPGR